MTSETALLHPENFEQWQAWQKSRRRVQRAKAALTRAVRGSHDDDRPSMMLTTRDAGVHGASLILFALDSDSPTALANVVPFLQYMSCSIGILHPEHVSVPGLDTLTDASLGDRIEVTVLEDPVREIADHLPSAVVTIGQHLEAGRILHEVARHTGIPAFVVQHGILTPHVFPLPAGATLLAWSEADAEFWCAGRPDVRSVVVGSQHLWQAAQQPRTAPLDERPVFLGQLHGSELPRLLNARTATRFIRDTGGLYRPHPREEDVLSRTQHAWWKKRGVEFADTSVALTDMPNQVAAVFSTGILEAAARDIPAWGYAPYGPRWVHELWERYGIARWGSSEPTPAPSFLDAEPAVAVARTLESKTGIA